MGSVPTGGHATLRPVEPQGVETGEPMEDETFKIVDIYVPMARRASLDLAVVNGIAESMLEEGQRTPIQVRRDGERLVLVEGLQRLEACRSLGEETIVGVIVRTRRK